MSARAPEIVYTVTLTKGQRAAIVNACNARLRDLDGSPIHRVSEWYDLAEAKGIVAEAPEVELDASGEPLGCEPNNLPDNCLVVPDELP